MRMLTAYDPWLTRARSTSAAGCAGELVANGGVGEGPESPGPSFRTMACPAGRGCWWRQRPVRGRWAATDDDRRSGEERELHARIRPPSRAENESRGSVTAPTTAVPAPALARFRLRRTSTRPAPARRSARGGACRRAGGTSGARMDGPRAGQHLGELGLGCRARDHRGTSVAERTVAFGFASRFSAHAGVAGWPSWSRAGPGSPIGIEIRCDVRGRPTCGRWWSRRARAGRPAPREPSCGGG